MKRCNLGRCNILRCFLLWLSFSSMPMVFFPLNALAAPAVQLARTGQTSCWDTGGNDTACEATGQDGETRLGVAWPEPRFADNGDGTITDRLTDLVWLKNADCGGVVTWQQALTAAGTLAAGTCGLADGSVAGEWRLPNRKELLSIMNFQQANGATWLAGQGFVNGIHGWYWTSDTYAPLPAVKWVVHTVGAAWADNHPQITTRDFHAVYVRDPNAAITVSPEAVAFGNVEVGIPSTSRVVTISNTGNAPLAVTAIEASGDDGGRFAIDPGDGSGGTCGTLSPRIAVGGNCTVSLIFNPIAERPHTASLSLYSNVGTMPTIVPLTGTGTITRYRVTATVSGGNGSISPAGTVEVPAGSTVTITVAPSTGYRSGEVTGTCAAGSWDGAMYMSGAVSADCSLVFTFVPMRFTINTAVSGNGAIACTPETTVDYLTPVSCTATPAAAHRISAAVVDGAAQEVSDPHSFVQSWGPITADHSLSVSFIADVPLFTVTPAITGNGIVEPGTPQVTAAGSSLTFTVAPESGYRIASVTGCRGTLEGASYTTAPVSENCTVTAAFEPVTLAEVLRAFRHAVGKIQLVGQEKQQYDVAPLGAGGKPEPDGIVDVADVVILLRRLSGLIAW